jgi:hypothetical protein
VLGRTNKKFIVFFFFCLAVVGGAFLLGGLVHAQSAAQGTLDVGINGPIGTQTGLSTTDVRLVVARIIRTALGLLGIIALVIVLYGGFMYMTAGGNEERVGTAKKILVNGGIGLLIILSSYAITSFVISRLVAATTGNLGTTTGTDVEVARSGGYRREWYTVSTLNNLFSCICSKNPRATQSNPLLGC